MVSLLQGQTTLQKKMDKSHKAGKRQRSQKRVLLVKRGNLLFSHLLRRQRTAGTRVCFREREAWVCRGSINLARGLLARGLLASLSLTSSVKGNGNAYFMKIKVT